jgi:hypothetical protein
MDYYDDYYENPATVYAGCYCKLNYLCSECKRSYN